MKKLKLDLDDIKVESFETNSSISKVGTVVGQEKGVEPDATAVYPTKFISCGGSCDLFTCLNPCDTANVTCINTCAGDTCWATCDPAGQTCGNPCTFVDCW